MIKDFITNNNLEYLSDSSQNFLYRDRAFVQLSLEVTKLYINGSAKFLKYFRLCLIKKNDYFSFDTTTLKPCEYESTVQLIKRLISVGVILRCQRKGDHLCGELSVVTPHVFSFFSGAFYEISIFAKLRATLESSTIIIPNLLFKFKGSENELREIDSIAVSPKGLFTFEAKSGNIDCDKLMLRASELSEFGIPRRNQFVIAPFYIKEVASQCKNAEIHFVTYDNLETTIKRYIA